VVEQAGIRPGHVVCDVGCGYGATARILSREFGASVIGFTVSEAQYVYACRRMDDQPNAPRYVLGDWLGNDITPDSFDVVLAIESTEHMVDVGRFLSEAGRVLRPDGRLVICAWLSADRPNPWEVRHLLRPICQEGRLAALVTADEYRAKLRAAGFADVVCQELTRRVRRTWDVSLGRMLHRMLTRRSSWEYLLDPRNASRIFAVTVLRIWLAYRTGCLKYGLLSGTKPELATG
ncbi:MAG: cyclopropane-fatty-acyl-phospholipid synthase family protein, partial [Gemmatimonadales bacterium]